MRKRWSKAVGPKLTFEEALALEFTSSGHSAPKVKDRDRRPRSRVLGHDLEMQELVAHCAPVTLEPGRVRSDGGTPPRIRTV